LSFPTALLPLRGVSPSEHPTIGTMISDYALNTNLSVATKTERLLLMRQGVYSQISPVERLKQGNSPIAPPRIYR
jgi:hypothetical protein